MINTILSVIDSYLLNFVASVSAGGWQVQIHHNFLLTGGDGCHRPCFIGPWYFLIYQSRISGDVIFILKNSFITIKNKKWGVLLGLLDLYLGQINPCHLASMMPEILANDLFRLLGFHSQCLCIGLLCVAVA